MFKVNEAIGVVLVSLLTLNIFTTYSSVSIVNFEHVIAGWHEWRYWRCDSPYPFNNLQRDNVFMVCFIF